MMKDPEIQDLRRSILSVCRETMEEREGNTDTDTQRSLRNTALRTQDKTGHRLGTTA